jgi:pilus assembly protein TadC
MQRILKFISKLPAICTLSVLMSSVVVLPSHAYIGPGAGISAIGSLVALVGAILLAIVGFVWYPFKRMMRRRKAAAADETIQTPDAHPESGTETGVQQTEKQRD